LVALPDQIGEFLDFGRVDATEFFGDAGEELAGG
jgi:hypothetical protein